MSIYGIVDDETYKRDAKTSNKETMTVQTRGVDHETAQVHSRAITQRECNKRREDMYEITSHAGQ